MAEARGILCVILAACEKPPVCKYLLCRRLLQDWDWDACFLRSLWDSETFSPLLTEAVWPSTSLLLGTVGLFGPGRKYFVEPTPGYYEGPWKLTFLSTVDWKSPDVRSSHLSFFFPPSFPRVLDQEWVMLGNLSRGRLPLLPLNLAALSHALEFSVLFVGVMDSGAGGAKGTFVLFWNCMFFYFWPPESTPLLPPQPHR